MMACGCGPGFKCKLTLGHSVRGATEGPKQKPVRGTGPQSFRDPPAAVICACCRRHAPPRPGWRHQYPPPFAYRQALLTSQNTWHHVSVFQVFWFGFQAASQRRDYVHIEITSSRADIESSSLGI